MVIAAAGSWKPAEKSAARLPDGVCRIDEVLRAVLAKHGLKQLQREVRRDRVHVRATQDDLNKAR